MACVTAEDVTYGFATGRCMVCGAPSSAYWHEEDCIELCGECARRICPALLADADVDDGWNERIEETEQEMVERYREAVAKRACRELVACL